MKTEKLVQNGILHSGEARHYTSWSLPKVPKLQISGEDMPEGNLFRRQKAHAPHVSQKKTRWIHFLNSFRKD